MGSREPVQIQLDYDDVSALISFLAGVDGLASGGLLDENHLRVLERMLERAEPRGDETASEYIHRRTEDLNQKLRGQLPERHGR